MYMCFNDILIFHTRCCALRCRTTPHGNATLCVWCERTVSRWQYYIEHVMRSRLSRIYMLAIHEKSPAVSGRRLQWRLVFRALVGLSTASPNALAIIGVVLPLGLQANISLDHGRFVCVWHWHTNYTTNKTKGCLWANVNLGIRPQFHVDHALGLMLAVLLFQNSWQKPDTN